MALLKSTIPSFSVSLQRAKPTHAKSATKPGWSEVRRSLCVDIRRRRANVFVFYAVGISVSHFWSGVEDRQFRQRRRTVTAKSRKGSQFQFFCADRLSEKNLLLVESGRQLPGDDVLPLSPIIANLDLEPA